MSYDAAKVAALRDRLAADPQVACYVGAMLSGATTVPSRCWGLFLTLQGEDAWVQANVIFELRDLVAAHLTDLAEQATRIARAHDDAEAGR